jgi:hypothetical protein
MEKIMDWQQALSLFFVFITAVIFVRSAMKKKVRASQHSSCGNCSGCSSEPSDARK